MKIPDAKTIKQARLDAQLTQKAAADLVGITTRAWQYYESGHTRIKQPTWRLFTSLVAAQKPTDA